MVEFSSSKRESMLKGALEQVPHLQRMAYQNSEFKGWLDRTTAAVKAEYGDNSPELRRFTNAAGKAFVVGTETGRQQEYARQIEAYEDVLKSLLGIQ